MPFRIAMCTTSVAVWAITLMAGIMSNGAFVTPYHTSTWLQQSVVPSGLALLSSPSSSTPEEIVSEPAIATSRAAIVTPSPLQESTINDFDLGTIDAGDIAVHPNCDEDETSEECVLGSEEALGECLPEKLVTLPRHTTSAKVDVLLRNTEHILRNMHINSTDIEMSQILAAKEAGRAHELIYANNYVDLGKIDT
jgi:hypothetical protein